jgi:hypothetical protein
MEIDMGVAFKCSFESFEEIVFGWVFLGALQLILKNEQIMESEIHDGPGDWR